MTVVVLPRLVGTRREVASYTSDLPADLTSQEIMLDCSALLSATPSFADEIVDVVLGQHGAARLIVVGAGADFVDDVRSAAAVRGLSDRLVIRPVAATAVAS